MLASTMQLTNNTPTPTTTNHSQQQQEGTRPNTPRVQPHTPIVCPQQATPNRTLSNPTTGRTQTQPESHSSFIDVPPSPKSAAHTRRRTLHTTKRVRRGIKVILLRKEVIQPHLPVRLPCYDLVPITDPTFDDSPQKAWAIGFGCYRLS